MNKRTSVETQEKISSEEMLKSNSIELRGADDTGSR